MPGPASPKSKPAVADATSVWMAVGSLLISLPALVGS